MSHMVFLSAFAICKGGDTAPFLTSWTLSPKTHNLSVHDPQFDEFSIPSLDDFMGVDRDELFLYPIRALRNYLTRMEQ